MPNTKQRKIKFTRGKVSLNIALDRLSFHDHDIAKVIKGNLSVDDIEVVLPQSEHSKLCGKGRLVFDLSTRDRLDIITNQLRRHVEYWEGTTAKLEELLVNDNKSLQKARSFLKTWTKAKKVLHGSD